MSRPIHRLSARTVATLTRAGYHADGGGLYLQVKPSGTKSWILRYQRHGKAREMGLGSFMVVGLAEARAAAQNARKLLAEDQDPIEARLTHRATEDAIPSFSQAAAAYIDAQRAGWQNQKHINQWRNTLATYAHPVIGDLPVDRVGTEHILRVLTPIWTSKTETATRVRQRIELILDACKVQGQRSGENPARWRGHIDKLLPKPSRVRKSKHLPAMPFAQVPAFIVKLRLRHGLDARALEFTILTAARTSQTLFATRNEIVDGTWRISAERMKVSRDHVVPLCKRAIEITQIVPARNEYLFSRANGKPMSTNAMDALLERMGYSEFTVHGFRSSFKDWATETTSYQNIISEMALAHAIPGGVEKAYRRGELLAWRTKLMNEWADFCDTGKKKSP